MAADNTPQERIKIQTHVDENLDYVYRDIANVFVGAGDVVIEFGNFHRSMPGHATISNRIVLSIANAMELQHILNAAIREAQENLKQQLNAD